MIYRLRYCNKDGVEARVDIQKGSSTPVIEVEGTERPFILSYNNDKGNKSGMFLSSSADIEIYETTDFNIDNLKTSNETELSVTHYINNVISWQGFIIPDFFSIEVRNNPVITMTASDRLGTLKNVTLSDLPSMISLRELAVLCLNKTGLELPLRTMADFNNGTGVNDFFNSKILTQRLSDTKGRSISCYDILSSILTASNSFLVQRSGGWHIINKIQHEAGSGKLYTGATSFINWSDVIFNFSDISIGGRRTIIPVASTVGVFHEFGGGRLHPENYDFSLDLTGWTPVGGFVATIDNRSVDTFTTGGSGGAIISPVYGGATEKKYLVNNNEYVRNVNPIYLESDPIPIFYKGPGAVNISLDINAVGPSASSAYIRVAIIATNGTDTKILDYSGNFIDYPDVNPPVFTTQFNDELAIAPTILKALSKGLAVSGKLEVEDDLSLYSLKIRLYGGGGGRYVLINSASVIVKSGANDNAKGIIYKVEREDNYTKAHEINTSLFADYLTTGLNGYFYDYSIDDTSSLYNSANELTSKWTAYNDTEQLPLLQHITRQRSRLFSVAHDLLSAEIEASNFDPLAIFVACGIRHTVVSAQFDFFKSNLSVELEEVAFQSANVRDFIYSYFGDGESGIKSIGGISSGGGGGGTGGGLTPEQIEILSFWKKDPDNPNTIFTEMNAYSKLELSAYGVGDGGGGGGGIIETVYGYDNLGQTFNNSILTDTFNAYTINQINTRLVSVENGSATTVNTTGTGNAITSISKAGTVITANKGLTFLETSIFNTHNTDNIRHITGAERNKWDGVVTDFGNLEIGGRNLLPENIIFYSPRWTRMGRYEYKVKSGGDTFPLFLIQDYAEVGKQYTLSFELKSTVDGAVFKNNTLYVNNALTVTHNSPELIKDKYVKVYGSFTYVEGGSYVHIYIYGVTNADELYLRNWKLEKGNKATDWTPAPEDQVSDWNTTDVNSFSFIKNKPTTLSGYGITDAYTKTEVNTALTSKLDKSVFDDLFEKVEVSAGVFAVKAKYNFYGVGEVSAYGIGSGGGSGGGIIETVYGYGNLGQTFNNAILTDTFNAYTINQINTRLVSVENGSATTVNTTGTGNAITSISKSGTIITADKGLTFSLSNHLHTGVYEPVFSKNTAFNKNFGTTAGTVAEGNHTHNYLPLNIGRPVVDLNTLYTSGIAGGGPSQTTNRPSGSYSYSPYMVMQSSTDRFVQLWFDSYGGSAIYYRNGTNSVWGDWVKLHHTGNLTSLSQLTDNIGVATHIANTSNPHSVTKAQVGLPNVDNTSDLNKPISTATQTALNTKLNLSGGTLSGNLSFSNQASHIRLSTGGDGNAYIGSSGLGTPQSGEQDYGVYISSNAYRDADGKWYHGRTSTIGAFRFKAGFHNHFLWSYSPNVGAGEITFTDLMSLRSNGNLGIGTTSPSEKLHVVGNILATGTTTTTKVIFNAAGWSMEQVGSELQLKYNNLIASRFLADGSIVGLGEVTAYGATTGGEGVSLLRTGGTMTGNLTMSADIIMNSGRAIGVSNLPLKLLGNALTYNASNVLTEANTATQIKMGNGWTIEQTVASLTIRKNGVIKGTFNA